MDLTKVEFNFNLADEKKPLTPNSEGNVEVSAYIPAPIIKWLQGNEQAPDEIKKLGEDVQTKLNWFVAYTILAQYARIPNLFEAIKALEIKRFDINQINEETDAAVISRKYKEANEQLNNILEFARKFGAQSKDALGGYDPNSEEKRIFEKLKALDATTLNKIMDIIKQAEEKK